MRTCHKVTAEVARRPDTGTWLCASCWAPAPIPCGRCGELRVIKSSLTGNPICGACRAKSRPRRPLLQGPAVQHLLKGRRRRIQQADPGTDDLACGPCQTLDLHGCIKHNIDATVNLGRLSLGGLLVGRNRQLL